LKGELAYFLVLSIIAFAIVTVVSATWMYFMSKAQAKGWIEELNSFISKRKEDNDAKENREVVRKGSGSKGEAGKGKREPIRISDKT